MGVGEGENSEWFDEHVNWRVRRGVQIKFWEVYDGAY